MTYINSLAEKGIDEAGFPLFFQDKWLCRERRGGRVSIYYNEKYKAVIPFIVHKKKFITIAKYIYKPLNFYGEELLNEAEVFDSFHSRLKEDAICDVIFPPMHVCLFKEVPRNVTYYDLGLLVVDLEKDDVLSRMNKTNIRQVKKAIKDGADAKVGKEQLSAFYEMYKFTHEKQNLPFESVKNIVELEQDLKGSTVFGASFKDESIESGFCCIYDRKTAYYLYGGSANKLKLQGSNKYLFYQQMLHFKSAGCKRFVLGGYRPNTVDSGKHAGIQNFKIKLGAQVEMGYHFYKVISPFKFFIFSMLLEIKSKLKGTDFFPINREGIVLKRRK